MSCFKYLSTFITLIEHQLMFLCIIGFDINMRSNLFYFILDAFVISLLYLHPSFCVNDLSISLIRYNLLMEFVA